MSSYAARPPLTNALLAVAIVGFLVPNAMVIAFLAQEGLAIGEYFSSWFESLPAAQLTADLAICCAAFFVWAAYDRPRNGVRSRELRDALSGPGAVAGPVLLLGRLVDAR